MILILSPAKITSRYWSFSWQDYASVVNCDTSRLYLELYLGYRRSFGRLVPYRSGQGAPHPCCLATLVAGEEGLADRDAGGNFLGENFLYFNLTALLNLIC